MDWLTWSVEIVKAIAWPTTAIIIAAAVEDPLRQLVKNMKLRSVAMGSTHLTLVESTQAALEELPSATREEGAFDRARLPVEAAPEVASAAEAPELATTPTPPAPRVGWPWPDMRNVTVEAPPRFAGEVFDLLTSGLTAVNAARHPGAAMLIAWSHLEMAINTLARQVGVPNSNRASLVALRLAEIGLIGHATVAVIQSLENARGALMHAVDTQQPSKEEAEHFVAAVESVRAVIENASRRSMRTLPQLLEGLKVDDPAKIRVGPMLTASVARTRELAAEQAESKFGRYIAQAGPVTMALTKPERDLLVGAGAQEVELGVIEESRRRRRYIKRE